MKKRDKILKGKEKVEVKEQPNYFNLAIEIVFLFFIFLMPVVFDRRVGIVFSLTKTVFMNIAMVVILSLWCLKILLGKKASWIHCALNWPIMTYLLSCTVATLTSVHVYTSLIGFYGRYEGLITLYVYALCAFIVINYFRSFVQLKRIAAVILVASTIMGIYGIIQRLAIDPYTWGGVVTWHRVIATVGQPNFLAAYMDMAFVLVLFLFLSHKPLPAKDQRGDFKLYWFDQLSILGYFLVPSLLFVVMIYNLGVEAPLVWYFGFGLMAVAALFFCFTFERLHPYLQDTICLLNLVIGYICLLNTISRGGYLGFWVAVFLFALFVGREVLFKEWKKLAFLGLLIGIISSAYFLNPQFSPLERFSSEVKLEKAETTEEGAPKAAIAAPEEKEATKVELGGAAGSRGETWKSAFGIIADHPLFGIGPEVLKMVFPRYETDLFRFKEAFHVKQDRCHNSVFDVNVTRGMVSFLIYVWLLFTVFKIGIVSLSRADLNHRLLMAAALTAIVSYKIQNQFSFGVVTIGSIYWICMGMVVSLGKKEEEPAEKGFSFKIEDIPWLPAAALVAAALLLIPLSVRPFLADLHYKSGTMLAERQGLDESMAEYRLSLKYSPYEGGTRTHYGIAMLNAAQQKGLNPQNLEEVASVLKEAAVVDPYNADNFHILGRIYLIEDQMGISGAMAKSLDYSEKALKIDPYYAEVWNNLGIAYEKKGEAQKAVEMYKRAFMINPNLTEPMDRLRALLARTGQARGAEDLFLEAVEKYPGFIPLRYSLGNIYLGEGKLDPALEQFRAILKLEEGNVPALLKIGEIYFRTNRLEEARDTLQQVVFIDPKNIDAHNGLGTAYLRLGQREKAKAEFEQVLMLDPANAYAQKMQGSLK